MAYNKPQKTIIMNMCRISVTGCEHDLYSLWNSALVGIPFMSRAPPPVFSSLDNIYCTQASLQKIHNRWKSICFKVMVIFLSTFLRKRFRLLFHYNWYPYVDVWILAVNIFPFLFLSIFSEIGCMRVYAGITAAESATMMMTVSLVYL